MIWWYALGAWGLAGWIGVLTLVVVALVSVRRRPEPPPRAQMPTPTFTPAQSEALRAASRHPPEPPPLPEPVAPPAPFPPGVIVRRLTGILPRYQLPGERPGEFPAVRPRPDGNYRFVSPDAYIRPRK